MKLQLPLIVHKKSLVYITLGIFFITFFILFFFQPFGDITHGYTIKGFFRILSYSLVASLVFFVCEFFLRDFIIDKQNKYSPFFWYPLEFVIIATAIFFNKEAWFGFKEVSFSTYFLLLYRVVIIGFIPILLLMILNYAYEKKSDDKEKLILTSKDVNPEYLSLFIEDILYLISEDNYVAVFYQHKTDIKKKILRGSLSFFENQIKQPLMRVHRSHIVNLLAIEKVDTNSQGGELTFSNQEVLKISRKYVTSFNQAWILMNEKA